MENLLNETKTKMWATEAKENRKRLPLVTIKQNSRNSQIIKHEHTIKRSESIMQMARRVSSTTVNKKIQQVASYLSKMPGKDRHLITAQMKCFMMAKHTHDSHLIDQRLTSSAIEKIKNSHKTQQNYEFKFSRFALFAETVIKKCGDSLILTSSFQECLKQKYPPSVQMMLTYLGVFLYSINSQYETAENYCQKMFDLIVKYKIEQFFIIYLILRIKLRTNLSEWQQALSLLTKLVFFSWMYSLPDLQIWCYFELSRVYFFLEMTKESEIFKIKSQNNSIEPKRSIYRQVSVANLIIEIQAIWQGQLDFRYNQVIQQSRLFIPEVSKYGVQQYISDQRKLKSNIKGIIQDCRIRHVNNLLTRIGEIGIHHIQKQNLNKSNYVSVPSSNQTGLHSSHGSLNSSHSLSQIDSLAAKSGNNFLLTHKSYNKNMNMFFRKRYNQGGSNQRTLYTIQNSQKNWSVLKQMLRNILAQMTFFSKNIQA